jgi:hypothetical protein
MRLRQIAVFSFLKIKTPNMNLAANNEWINLNKILHFYNLLTNLILSCYCDREEGNRENKRNKITLQKKQNKTNSSFN